MTTQRTLNKERRTTEAALLESIRNAATASGTTAHDALEIRCRAYRAYAEARSILDSVENPQVVFVESEDPPQTEASTQPPRDGEETAGAVEAVSPGYHVMEDYDDG